MVLSGENQSETEVCRTQALMRCFHFLPTCGCGFSNGSYAPTR